MINKRKPSNSKLVLLLVIASIFIFLSIALADSGNAKIRYVSGSDVNLRNSPDLNSDILLILKNGEKLYVETYKNSWVKVKTEDGYAGWVHEKFITKNSSNQISSRGNHENLKVRYINTGAVNLRESPSLAGYIVTSLNHGEKVYAESYDSSGWISIYLEDGTFGWVHEKFVEATPPSPDENVKIRYIIGNGVNVRSNPTKNAEIVTVAAKGDKCYVSTYNDGWVKIKFSDGTSGWVHEKFIGTSTSETPGMKVRYVVGSDINLRTEANLNSSVIGVAKNGEKIFVETYDEAGWAYVAFEDGTKAWISDDYISSTPLPDGMKIRYVCGNGVNVRKDPELGSSIVTIANAGDKAFVDAYDTDGWARVVLEGERTGWINEKYLTNNLGEANEITASKVRYIQGNGVNLRESASLSASIITTLNNAVEVYVESYDEAGWVSVATAEGKKGWVYKGYVGVDILPDIIVTQPSYNTAYTDTSNDSAYTDSSNNNSYQNTYTAPPPPPSISGNSLVDTAYSYMGVPYVWGGTTAYGFDCSGFAQTVYSNNGIYIPRTADAQYAEGSYVSTDSLSPGDLVFFETYTWGASHVGIYIGNSEFIHASSGAGCVVISSLDQSYYSQRYLGAKRY